MKITTASFSLILLFVLAAACTKNESEMPVIEPTVMCTGQGDLEGRWETDSVNVTVYREDSVDTNNHGGPHIYFYFLDVHCNDSVKEAWMRYHTLVTQAPVQVARTQNFTRGPDQLYFLGDNQLLSDSADANLILNIDSLSDTVLNASYWTTLSDTFRVQYQLYFKRR